MTRVDGLIAEALSGGRLLPGDVRCPDGCEEDRYGTFRVGECDDCGGDESGESDCSNCSGTGSPVCCRCEGTGVDLTLGHTQGAKDRVNKHFLKPCGDAGCACKGVRHWQGPGADQTPSAFLRRFS